MRTNSFTQQFFAIASMYARGERLDLIGREYGVSRQRVYTIARRVGLSLRYPQKRPGGAA